MLFTTFYLKQTATAAICEHIFHNNKSNFMVYFTHIILVRAYEQNIIYFIPVYNSFVLYCSFIT